MSCRFLLQGNLPNPGIEPTAPASSSGQILSKSQIIMTSNNPTPLVWYLLISHLLSHIHQVQELGQSKCSSQKPFLPDCHHGGSSPKSCSQTLYIQGQSPESRPALRHGWFQHCVCKIRFAILTLHLLPMKNSISPNWKLNQYAFILTITRKKVAE